MVSGKPRMVETQPITGGFDMVQFMAVMKQMKAESTSTSKMIAEKLVGKGYERSEVGVTSSEDKGENDELLRNSEEESENSDGDGNDYVTEEVPQSEVYSEANFGFLDKTAEDGEKIFERKCIQNVPSTDMKDSLGHMETLKLSGVVHDGHVQSVGDLIAEQIEPVEDEVWDTSSASEDEGERC